MQKHIEQWKQRGHAYFQHADLRLRGIPGVLLDAFTQFKKARGAEAAASMAFFTIFSLFPLLLSIVAISSFFLESQRIQMQVLELVRLVFPVAPGLIIDNINEVLRERTAFGLTGAIGLLWAGPLNLIKARLVGVLVIIALVLLLFLVRFAAAFINLVPELSYLFSEQGFLNGSPLRSYLTFFVYMLVNFLIFLGLFRWIPNAHVLWSEAFWGALLAAVGWELTTNLFTWLLTTGLANYQVVYGSLGSMIALLFWIYLNSIIIIFSAHLSAAIARKNRPYSEDTKQQTELTEWA
jgi:membrane protein